MILHLSKFKSHFAALALLGVFGCGSEATPTSSAVDLPGSGAAAESEVDVQAIGVVTGHYRDGHVSFDPMQPLGAAAPGLAAQGFGTFTLNKLTFDTDDGDGVGVGGIPEGCSGTQYCARVNITNNTGRIMESLYSEITDYFNVAPASATPHWAGATFNRSAAYKSVFLHGTGTVEAANYGNFTVGQKKAASFIFELDGATYFDFHVTEYATFPRVSITGSGRNNVTATNACSGGTLITDVDDAEGTIDLPFPFTMQDRTYDRAVVGSNGYLLLFTGLTGPSLGLPSMANSNKNTAIAPAYQLPGFYPFWDDLAFDAGDGVCWRVTGSKPNRTFFVTWSNAKIANNQPTIPKTFGSERVTYSVSLQEQSDNFKLIYTLPSSGITPLTRGSSATIMFVYYRGGSLGSAVYGYNGPSVPPAGISSYPYAYDGAQYNPNP